LKRPWLMEADEHLRKMIPHLKLLSDKKRGRFKKSERAHNELVIGAALRAIDLLKNQRADRIAEAAIEAEALRAKVDAEEQEAFRKGKADLDRMRKTGKISDTDYKNLLLSNRLNKRFVKRAERSKATNTIGAEDRTGARARRVPARGRNADRDPGRED